MMHPWKAAVSLDVVPKALPGRLSLAIFLVEQLHPCDMLHDLRHQGREAADEADPLDVVDDDVWLDVGDLA